MNAQPALHTLTRALLSVAGEPSGDGRTYLVDEAEARRWCADACLNATETDVVLADLAGQPCAAHPILCRRFPVIAPHPERRERLLALTDVACAARTNVEYAAARSTLVRRWVARDTHCAIRIA